MSPVRTRYPAPQSDRGSRQPPGSPSFLLGLSPTAPTFLGGRVAFSSSSGVVNKVLDTVSALPFRQAPATLGVVGGRVDARSEVDGVARLLQVVRQKVREAAGHDEVGVA